MKIAILDDYQNVALRLADWYAVRRYAEIVVFNDHVVEASAVIERLRPFDVVCVMRERTPLPREILQQLPNLKLIASTGPRNASIDSQAATDHGIAVTATGYDSTPTIEFTWSLILASMRGIDREAASLKSGGWQIGLGSNLRGKTLAVVGLGNIGKEIARIGLAFGMKVIAWSRNLTEETASAAGARRLAAQRRTGSGDGHLHSQRLGRYGGGRVAQSGADDYRQMRRILHEEAKMNESQKRVLADAAQGPQTESPVNLIVNGQTCSITLDPRITLLDALREKLALTGTKKACDRGECGACTVHVEGRRVLSCMTLAAMLEGKRVTTIEGLEHDGKLHPLQSAFIEHDGFQCGFCTSGQIMSGVAMIEEAKAGWPSAATVDVRRVFTLMDLSRAEIRERMSGNLCRCACYPNIVDAVEEAVARS